MCLLEKLLYFMKIFLTSLLDLYVAESLDTPPLLKDDQKPASDDADARYVQSVAHFRRLMTSEKQMFSVIVLLLTDTAYGRHPHQTRKVRQVCINCGVCMGKYFCATCKLFDDDISKQQYHCNCCGICRIGGRENFFHCFTCGCCYLVLLKNSHPCVEGAMHHDCPVCFEYLFESTNDVSVLPCGHTIHVHCLKEMQQHFQYACPLCSKSVCDMSKVWEVLDMEVAATPMPESKMVRILCNDCGATSDVHFHVVAQKCLNCKSYNTRQM